MTAASGFQAQVGVQPAPAVAGDWASANPRYSVAAGPGGLVAGPLGLTIGLFGWLSYAITDANAAPAQANNYGSGVPDGFVHREQQALITAYLGIAGMTIPAGFPCTLMAAADVWVVNNNASTPAEPGMKAYANVSNGQATFAATGTPGTATSSSFTIAPETWSATATIVGNVATLSAVTGTVAIGSLFSGTGVTSGQQIVAQLSGTPLGAGTYQVKYGEQNVAGVSLSGTYGLLTVGGTVAGVFGVGQSLSSSGADVSAGTQITSLGTGAGAAGTYYVQNTQTSSSGTLTAATTVETSWVATSFALPGELVKMRRLP